MSYKKTEHAFSSDQAALLEQKVGEKIAEILRQEYAGTPSAVKLISAKTKIAPGTIKNWYIGRNPPRLVHFLMLARHYPAALCVLLGAVGHDYLVPHIRSPELESETAAPVQKKEPVAGKNVTINVTLKSKTANLNGRQAWFLERLRSGSKLTAQDICRQWSVLLRTSRRDIAILKARGLIVFVGAKKAGWYESTA
jgi:hypothetical protein